MSENRGAPGRDSLSVVDAIHALVEGLEGGWERVSPRTMFDTDGPASLRGQAACCLLIGLAGSGQGDCLRTWTIGLKKRHAGIVRRLRVFSKHHHRHNLHATLFQHGDGSFFPSFDSKESAKTFDRGRLRYSVGKLFGKRGQGDPPVGMKHAIDILGACMAHPSELVRISAAFALRSICGTSLADLFGLQGVLLSDDRLESLSLDGDRTESSPPGDFASVGAEPEVVAASLSGDQNPAACGSPVLLVHGTLFTPYRPAVPPHWWDHGGDLRTHLVNLGFPVSSVAPPFTWVGYSDNARDVAAQALKTWVDAHCPGAVRIVAHSHGGNIAMRASNYGLDIDRLVLLSCPPDDPLCQPDPRRLGKVVSVRVPLDVVVIADQLRRGRPNSLRGKIKNCQEVIVKTWPWRHGATRTVKVWSDHQLHAHLE